MPKLVELVQLGGIGASLAFLLLGYYLLSREQSLKDETKKPLKPRPEILAAIRGFIRMALVFFCVGVVAQLLACHTDQLITIASNAFLKGELVGLRFTNWIFRPTEDLVSMSFVEDRFNPQKYVLPTEAEHHNIIVAVRTHTTLPESDGAYPLVLGPYSLAARSNLTQPISADQKRELGTCVDFVIFALRKTSSDASASVRQPFAPSEYKGLVKILDSKYAGERCSL